MLRGEKSNLIYQSLHFLCVSFNSYELYNNSHYFEKAKAHQFGNIKSTYIICVCNHLEIKALSFHLIEVYIVLKIEKM